MTIKELFCDFCSEPNIEWCYPTRDFTVPDIHYIPDPDFAACQICHDLIEADNWEGLAERAAQTFIEKNGAIFEDLTEDKKRIVSHMASFHLRFKQNRTGPATPEKLKITE